MRLTKLEKEKLFELTDAMTDRCPELTICQMENDRDREIFYGIFRKLRLELKGY